jgi:hypothetical protein
MSGSSDTGSRTIQVGAGSNHRALAAFLWGQAELECPDYRAIKIVDDTYDHDLLDSCRLLIPIFEDRYLGDVEGDAIRNRIVAFANRLRELEPHFLQHLCEEAGQILTGPFVYMTLDDKIRFAESMIAEHSSIARRKWWKGRR